jgi:outer membrane immunogenic protein
MRRFSVAVISCFLSLAIIRVAAATDLPVKPVYKAPEVAPVTNWEGFYIGGHFGYGWDPASATFNPVVYVTSAVPGLPITGSSGPVNLSVEPEGWLGGAQLGYNWQRQSWVFGLAADISWSDIEDSASAPWFVNSLALQEVPFKVTGIVRLEQKLDYFGTLRGRLGWANNALLLYVTGGAAWGHVKTTFSNSDIGVSGAGGALTPAQVSALQAGGYASTSDIRWGYTVGGGLEWMFARNWSVKAEYLYIDLLGTDTLAITGGVATAGDMSVNIARVGVNYFFR